MSTNNHPNLLFLCADDHRADAVGALGHPVLRTPHWDRLTHEGTTFTHMFTTVPICTPARAELLTGCNAFSNGVRWFGDTTDPARTTLAQGFAGAGYQTFFTGKWHNDGTPDTRGYEITRRVFVGGMRDHVMTFEENGHSVSGFSSELFAEAAMQFIGGENRDTGRPWLAQVAFTAPHDPRTPPPGWRPDPATLPLPPSFLPEHAFDNGEMTIRDEQLEKWPRTPDAVREHLADYYGMLAHLDAQVGRLLDALEATGQAQNTLVVYTGDHGLAVGSHGLMGKMSMYDHSVRVPLLLRGPGVPAGIRSAALCQSFDLFPTLCDLAGVPIPPSVAEGRSLRPVLLGEASAHRDAVFGAYRDVQRMVRTARWKYIEYPQINKTQLFDLENDPHELSDLLPPWRYRKTSWYAPPTDGSELFAVADELRARLRDWQQSVNDPLLKTGTTA